MADNTQTLPRDADSSENRPANENDNNSSAVIVQPVSRGTNRSWAYTFAVLGLAFLATPFSLLSTSLGRAPIDPTDYALRTKRVLETTPLIDGHNDLPWLLRVELHNRIRDEKFDPRRKLLGHTDIARMRQGMMGGQFWSVYVHCDAAQEHFDDPSVGKTC
jgi:membrane dipeptidase